MNNSRECCTQQGITQKFCCYETRKRKLIVLWENAPFDWLSFETMLIFPWWRWHRGKQLVRFELLYTQQFGFNDLYWNIKHSWWMELHQFVKKRTLTWIKARKRSSSIYLLGFVRKITDWRPSKSDYVLRVWIMDVGYIMFS